MPKHPHQPGPPQYLHVRASYELAENRVRGQRASIAGAFCAGAMKGVVIGVLPVLLVVGALDYLANGWSNFGPELLSHWTFIAGPLVVFAFCGGVVGALRR